MVKKNLKQKAHKFAHSRFVNAHLVVYIIPVFLFAIAFFWKLAYINYRDLCLDEPFTVFNAQKNLSDIVKISAQGEPTPPLFMILLHFWMKITGLNAAYLRILPLFFNALTVVFIYKAGQKFFSLWAGLLASVLFLFSTYHFYIGLEARTYSFFSLTTAASLYFYLVYSNDLKNFKALGALVFSNILLIYSHYFGWFVVFSEFLTSFIYIRSFRSFFRFMLIPAGTLIGFIPMIPVLIRQFDKSTRIGTWLNPPNPSDYYEQICYFLNHRHVLSVLLYIILAGIAALAIAVILKKFKKPSLNLLTLFIWWFVPYTIMYLVSSKVPMFNPKYILFNSIGLYLFIAAIIHILFNWPALLEVAAGAVLAVFMYLNLQILPDYMALRKVKDSVDYVKHMENNKSIVIIYPVWADFAFTFYYNQTIFRNHESFYREMVENDLYRVWGLDNVKSVLRANPGYRVIYYQDGRNNNPNENIFAYLDSTYTRVDRKTFPQTFDVAVYDPKSK